MRFFTYLCALAPLALASPTPDLEKRACKSGIKPAYKNEVVSKFKSSAIVTDLIPSISPKIPVKVNFSGKKVRLGTQFTTAETSMQPVVTFNKEPGYPTSTNYSVFLVDRDVPMRGPTSVPFLHWYYAHAHPSCVKTQSPQTVTAYELPTPGSTTQHRYVFLVYREPAGYMPDTVTAQARPGFDVVSYAQKAGLKLVGGNYFLEAITNT